MDPHNLTVGQLKQLLRENGIDVPRGARKRKLVAMYRASVAEGKRKSQDADRDESRFDTESIIPQSIDSELSEPLMGEDNGVNTKSGRSVIYREQAKSDSTRPISASPINLSEPPYIHAKHSDAEGGTAEEALTTDFPLTPRKRRSEAHESPIAKRIHTKQPYKPRENSPVPIDQFDTSSHSSNESSGTPDFGNVIGKPVSDKAVNDYPSTSQEAAHQETIHEINIVLADDEGRLGSHSDNKSSYFLPSASDIEVQEEFRNDGDVETVNASRDDSIPPVSTTPNLQFSNAHEVNFNNVSITHLHDNWNYESAKGHQEDTVVPHLAPKTEGKSEMDGEANRNTQDAVLPSTSGYESDTEARKRDLSVTNDGKSTTPIVEEISDSHDIETYSSSLQPKIEIPDQVRPSSVITEQPGFEEVELAYTDIISYESDGTEYDGILGESEYLSNEGTSSDSERAFEKANSSDNPSTGNSAYSLSGLLSLLRGILLFICIVTSVLYALWYREQRIRVGYCGHELAIHNLSSILKTHNPVVTKLDGFLQDHGPRCLPCPSNAICYPEMQVKCRPKYKLRKSPFSLEGLIPVTDFCVMDSERDALVNEVVKKTREFLRVQNARHACGRGPDDMVSGFRTNDLYKIFHESRNPSFSQEEFDEMWHQAMSDLAKEPEIIMRQLSTDDTALRNGSNDNQQRAVHQREEEHFWKYQERENQIIRSTSKRYVSLRCKFENEIYLTYYHYRHIIWSALVMLLSYQYLAYKFKQYFSERERVKDLTTQVIKRLKETKMSLISENYLSCVQLRDTFLADIDDMNKRNHLWNEVASDVRTNNTNIKESLIEVHGDMMKCWEWIGPI